MSNMNDFFLAIVSRFFEFLMRELILLFMALLYTTFAHVKLMPVLG